MNVLINIHPFLSHPTLFFRTAAPPVAQVPKKLMSGGGGGGGTPIIIIIIIILGVKSRGANPNRIVGGTYTDPPKVTRKSQKS